MGYTGRKIVPMLESNADLATVIAKINELSQAFILLQDSVEKMRATSSSQPNVQQNNKQILSAVTQHVNREIRKLSSRIEVDRNANENYSK